MLAKIHSLIKSRLESSDTDQSAKADDLQLAAAALLIEVSAADFEHHPDERRAMFDALVNVFKLDETAVNELLVLAEQAAGDATSMYEFTSVLNESCSHDEKLYLLEQLWRVALADGHLDKYEDHRIRKLADLLYLSHREFIQAKHRAETD